MARRDDILDHAERLFTAQGFHGTTLAEIAKAAGLGNAGLIHHFPSKQKLYRDVLKRVATDLETEVESALTDVTTPLERLRAVARAIVKWSTTTGRSQLLVRELLDNASRLESARSLPLSRFVLSCTEIAKAAGMRHPFVVISRIFGTIAYAQIARPTFARMSPDRLLSEKKRWMAAVLEDLEAHW